MPRPLTPQSDSVERGAPFIELLIVIAVIATAAALQWREFSTGLFKAITIEPFISIRPLQMEVLERLAETGSLDGASSAPARASREAVASRRIASVRDLEEVQASVVRASEAAQEEVAPGRRSKQTGNLVMDVSEGVPVAAMFAPGMDRPRLIEFRPALAAREPAVLNWLCGAQVAPEGMQARPPREPAVSSEILPIVCRVKL